MKHTKILSKALCLLLCAVTLASLTGCGETRKVQREVYAMDTVMTLIAYGKNAEKGLNAAESVIKSMDAMLDPELETSTVYAINHAQGGSTVVTGQVADMLSKAYGIYQKTKTYNSSATGMLDLTLYPLIKKWGFVDSKYYTRQTRRYRSSLQGAALTRWCCQAFRHPVRIPSLSRPTAS